MYDTLALFFSEPTAMKIKLLRKGKPNAFTWKIDVMKNGKLVKTNTYQSPATARQQFKTEIQELISVTNLVG